MPKQRTNKTLEQVKREMSVPAPEVLDNYGLNMWVVSFHERQAFLTCPICNHTIDYNIVETPAYCPSCRTQLRGIKHNG